MEYNRVQAPSHSVDWSGVGFTPHPVNGRIQCTFSSDTGCWSEPQWIASPMIQVHGFAPGLNYGQQAFEGLRVFRDAEGGIRLFRLAAHTARFARSAAAVGIPAVPAPLFEQAVRLAVYLNSEFVPPFAHAGSSMYVRPVAFASSATLDLRPAEAYTLIVMVTPVAVLYRPVGLRALVVEAFDRTAPRGTGAVKIGGNYGPTVPVMQAAREKGFALTLHLDAQTNSTVHEFSASGFAAIKSRPGPSGPFRTLVIPKHDQILPSITVDSVATIAASLGWEIPLTELASFTEVYTVGTASSLVPVSSIVHGSARDCYNFTVDAASPEAAHNILNERLHSIKRGITLESWGWVEQLKADKVLPDVERMLELS